MRDKTASGVVATQDPVAVCSEHCDGPAFVPRKPSIAAAEVLLRVAEAGR